MASEQSINQAERGFDREKMSRPLVGSLARGAVLLDYDGPRKLFFLEGSI